MSTQADVDALAAQIIAFTGTIASTPVPTPPAALDISALQTAFTGLEAAFTVFVASVAAQP